MSLSGTSAARPGGARRPEAGPSASASSSADEDVVVRGVRGFAPEGRASCREVCPEGARPGIVPRQDEPCSSAAVASTPVQRAAGRQSVRVVTIRGRRKVATRAVAGCSGAAQGAARVSVSPALVAPGAEGGASPCATQPRTPGSSEARRLVSVWACGFRAHGWLGVLLLI